MIYTMTTVNFMVAKASLYHINRQRSKARNIDDPNLEDDGYLLVLVNNVNKRRTELRMYDCKCFGERNSLKCTIESPEDCCL